jgi:hypothetical protein
LALGNETAGRIIKFTQGIEGRPGPGGGASRAESTRRSHDKPGAAPYPNDQGTDGNDRFFGRDYAEANLKNP